MSLPQSSSSCVFVCAGILHIPGIRCSLFQELKCDFLPPHEDSRNHFSCFSTVKCQKFAAKIRHRILYNVSSNLIYFILCVCLCSPFSLQCYSCQQCTRLNSVLLYGVPSFLPVSAFFLSFLSVPRLCFVPSALLFFWCVGCCPLLYRLFFTCSSSCVMNDGRRSSYPNRIRCSRLLSHGREISVFPLRLEILKRLHFLAFFRLYVLFRDSEYIEMIIIKDTEIKEKYK